MKWLSLLLIVLLGPALHAVTHVYPFGDSNFYVMEEFNHLYVTSFPSGAAPSCGRNFGSGVIGRRSTVTIRIVPGVQPLTLQTPTVTRGEADFSVLAVEPGDGGIDESGNGPDPTIAFKIAFNPTSLGFKVGCVSFMTVEGGQQRVFDINVTGIGVAAPVPKLRVTRDSPTGLPLYPEIAHENFYADGSFISQPVTVYVTNIGEIGAPHLVVDVPTLSGRSEDINLSLPGYLFNVPQGTSTSFTIAANPHGPGVKESTLSITHNDHYTFDTTYELKLTTLENRFSNHGLPSECTASAGAAALPCAFVPVLAVVLWRRRKLGKGRTCATS